MTEMENNVHYFEKWPIFIEIVNWKKSMENWKLRIIIGRVAGECVFL